MDNLEKAALPSTEEAERKRLLSFVVCGGGPTGGEPFCENLDLGRWDETADQPLHCSRVRGGALRHGQRGRPRLRSSPLSSQLLHVLTVYNALVPCALFQPPTFVRPHNRCPRSCATRSRCTSSSRATTSLTRTRRRSATTPRPSSRATRSTRSSTRASRRCATAPSCTPTRTPKARRLRRSSTVDLRSGVLGSVSLS